MPPAGLSACGTAHRLREPPARIITSRAIAREECFIHFYHEYLMGRVQGSISKGARSPERLGDCLTPAAQITTPS